VRAWAGVHTKTHNHPARGSYRPKATVRGTLVPVEVERLPRQTRIPKRLWLWWRGPAQPDLAVVWRAYVHRFDLEHTYRFCKQTLNWTTPRVRTPQQADRWTWLVRRVGAHSIPFAERRGSESIPLGQRLTRGRKSNGTVACRRSGTYPKVCGVRSRKTRAPR
jgi:hypothetical protein